MVTSVIFKRKRNDVKEEAEKSVKKLRIRYTFNPTKNLPINLSSCIPLVRNATRLSYNQKENKRLTNLSKLCGDTFKKSFFRNMKLCLVLDLDHTLLYSVKILNVSCDQQEYLNRKARVLSSMEEINSSGTNLYNHSERYTKLRPFAREFLKEVNTMFTLYVYTMGSRGYARQMTTILDPQSVYFKSRKNLDVVVGADERNTIIIHDTPSVLKQNGKNLIRINRCNYFTLITGAHKLKKEDQESFVDKDGALKSILEVLKCAHMSFFLPEACVEQDYKTVDVRPVLKKVFESSF
ncbi:hypothetical protein MKX01_018637 [Papaver californicum]|nr:hypothetical protein MKX01_018637 [Papaver californicum]